MSSALGTIGFLSLIDGDTLVFFREQEGYEEWQRWHLASSGRNFPGRQASQQNRRVFKQDQER